MWEILNFVATCIQGGLYAFLIEKVDGFRSFIGAPETEKFNIVLLGGMKRVNQLPGT